MRKEFMVERQGRAFCLYAGLLDLAHQQGLKSIRTELIQIPAEANNRVAICTATAILEKDGVERTFHGIGDAAPNNVAPAMQTCLLRMAETRAKARALRDAVNIGVAAFEELGEEDATEDAPERGYSAPSRPTANPPATRRSQPARPAVNPAAPSTDTQIEAIRALCRRQSIDPEKLAAEKHNISLSNLTALQASEMIKMLNTPTRAN